MFCTIRSLCFKENSTRYCTHRTDSAAAPTPGSARVPASPARGRQEAAVGGRNLPAPMLWGYPGDSFLPSVVAGRKRSIGGKSAGGFPRNQTIPAAGRLSRLGFRPCRLASIDAISTHAPKQDRDAPGTRSKTAGRERAIIVTIYVYQSIYHLKDV